MAGKRRRAAMRRYRWQQIPEAVVRRLSYYLRELERQTAQGRDTISSSELARTLGLTDSQVRKDLAFFGQFGYRGRGYHCRELAAAIRRILGTEKIWPVAVIGLGNLGRALLGYRGFAEHGFPIVAGLDIDPRRLEPPVPGVVLRPLEQLSDVVRTLSVRMAILAVPAAAAQEVADQLVQAGIQGILNFAPISLSLPPQVRLVRVDLAMELEQLAYTLAHSRARRRPPPDS
ncbi:MAG: redox-sensing transcriptional repressor Rex [Pirellulaceae bacterium]|nr:MAG: redox-sensing transcriptional repressor Rex [Pirellulaceae bacterium]